MSRRNACGRRLLALAAAAAAAAAAIPASAQDADAPPPGIAPLRVETDHVGVNLVTGRIAIDLPALQVPGAPNLRFERVQNSTPFMSGRLTGTGTLPLTGNFWVHSGTGSSEQIRCVEGQGCTSVTGTGSIFTAIGPASNTRCYDTPQPMPPDSCGALFQQAGTGAIWHFDKRHVEQVGPSGTSVLFYASRVEYPDGETITFDHDVAIGGAFFAWFHRTNRMTSNRGYFITITYQGQSFYDDPTAWGTVKEATIFSSAAPNVALGRLSYGADGTTITQSGEALQNPRTYSCANCADCLTAEIEVGEGSLRLPGETQGPPALVVTASTSRGRKFRAIPRSGSWDR